MLGDRSLSRFSMAIPASWLRGLGKLNVPIYRLTRGRLMAEVGQATPTPRSRSARATGSCARVSGGEERAELWRRMNAQYEGFDHYEANTARDIAVFVLEPR
jgi:F420H(2)-dependent quinone reductase